MDNPWYKDGDTWGVIFWISLIVLFLFWTPITSYLATIPVTCVDQVTDFTTRTVEDSSMKFDQSFTSSGTKGMKHVCTGRDGSDQGSVVRYEPLEAVYHKGTKVEETTTYVAPVYQYSGGSTCNDGTHSNSTGRGTCSHHGGVAY